MLFIFITKRYTLWLYW